MCSVASPLYLKHGKARGAHAVVQAGKCQGPNQQCLWQAPDAVIETRLELLPRSRLTPAQALMFWWVLQAVMQALGAVGRLLQEDAMAPVLACMAVLVHNLSLSSIRLLGGGLASSLM